MSTQHIGTTSGGDAVEVRHLSTGLYKVFVGGRPVGPAHAEEGDALAAADYEAN